MQKIAAITNAAKTKCVYTEQRIITQARKMSAYNEIESLQSWLLSACDTFAQRQKCRKRKSLSLIEKYAIIQEKENDPSLTLDQLSTRYSCGKSTISEVLGKQRSKILT